MSRIKSSLFIEDKVWREIKKAAIAAGQTVGEFIARIFIGWRCGQDADSKPTDTPGGAKNKAD